MYTSNRHIDAPVLVNAAGAVTQNYRYDAFGNQEAPSPTDTNPFRYAGEYFDQETGNIYLRARYYDSATGRFTQEDPVRDGMNWYVYCNGNPVMWIDPSGLRDVMLKYIAEKYGGSVSFNPDTGRATVSMPGYAPIETSGKIINDRMIVDSQFFVDNFGLSEEQVIHQAGDSFDREIDAVTAFGLMEGPKSISDNLEHGSYIIRVGDKYTYTSVCVLGKDTGQISWKPVGGAQIVGIVHTHGRYDKRYDYRNHPEKNSGMAQDNNILFSPGDRQQLAALQNMNNGYVSYNAKSYLFNPIGQLLMIQNKDDANNFVSAGFACDFSAPY